MFLGLPVVLFPSKTGFTVTKIFTRNEKVLHKFHEQSRTIQNAYTSIYACIHHKTIDLSFIMASGCSKELEQTWIKEQIDLKKKLITEDDVDWKTYNEPVFGALHLIGGVDISFQKDDEDHACPGLVVLSYPDLKVLYEDFTLDHLEFPYKSQFLAFREVPLLKDKIDRLKREHPQLMPQVIMVDGNGIHHERGFGIACHLGVLTDIPTIGVAKNLLHIDGVSKDAEHSKQIQDHLKSKGDRFPLKGKSGVPTGMALRSSKPCGTSACKPIYVSVGHRIGLKTAVELVHSCCQHRIPEPTRQADILSRKYLRENYKEELTKCSCKNGSKV